MDIDLKAIFTDILNSFVSGIPNLIIAIILLIIGFIIAKIVKRIVQKALETVGIDKIGEKLNEIELISKADIEIKFSAVIAKILYYVIFLVFIIAATSALNIPEVSNLMTSIIEFLPNLIVAGIILVIGFIFSEMIRTIAYTALASFGIPSARLISSFLFYFMLVNIIVSALSQASINTDFLGQNISILIAGIIFAFSIGYGLASKTVMANFIGSMYSNNKINIGDKVKIDGIEGEIINIDKSAMTIFTKNESKVYVPLSKMTSDTFEILK